MAKETNKRIFVGMDVAARTGDFVALTGLRYSADAPMQVQGPTARCATSDIERLLSGDAVRDFGLSVWDQPFLKSLLEATRVQWMHVYSSGGVVRFWIKSGAVLSLEKAGYADDTEWFRGLMILRYGSANVTEIEPTAEGGTVFAVDIDNAALASYSRRKLYREAERLFSPPPSDIVMEWAGTPTP